MSRNRISITLPPELVEAADRRAGELDRSRSWVVAEALRFYFEHAHAANETAARQGSVREAAKVPYGAAGLGEQRAAQLQADLALTPEQRVREAEATARSILTRDAERLRDRILMFAHYEDYLAWDRWAELRPP